MFEAGCTSRLLFPATVLLYLLLTEIEKMKFKRRERHHRLLINLTTTNTTFLLYLLYLLSISVIVPSNPQQNFLVNGQLLEGIQPLTKEAFELAFEQVYQKDNNEREDKDDLSEGDSLFRQFFSAALLFTRFDLEHLGEGNGEKSQQEQPQLLVPVSSCLIYLREYGKGLMGRYCAQKIKEHPLIDKRLRHFLLAYRCFYSSSPHDYELHTATIERIALTTEGWTVSFRPQETYLCQVRWTVAETVQRTMAFLKEHGLLRGAEGVGVDENVIVEEGVRGGETRRDNEEIELLQQPPPPLSHERFESAFSRLRKEFHLFPFFGYLFTRDLREGGQWTPVRECFINLGLTPGKAIVVSRCAALIRQYQRIDPKMPNLFVVYRCFKSESPYDYELVVTPLLKLYTESSVSAVAAAVYGSLPAMSAHEYSSAASTPAYSHRNGIILFRPYSGASHCTVGLMGSRPVDALLFAHYLNDSGAVESSRIEPSRKDGECDSVVPQVEPLTKAQFEAAFPLASGFSGRPFLSYIFVRDLESVLTRALLPLRLCQVLLYEEGKGVVAPACAEVLGHYSAIGPQGLHNLILLPYRCFHKATPKEDGGDLLKLNLKKYDLFNATISGLFMEEGQYVLRFRLKTFQTDHCAPVWAKEYALDQLQTKIEDDEEVDGKTDDSVTRKRSDEL